MSFDSNSLQALCQELNTSQESTKEAEKFCASFLRNNNLQQPLYLYISATLAACSKLKKFPPNFVPSLFKTLVAGEDFVEFFKAFLKAVDVGNSVECEAIVEKYAFACRLYKKFVEKWAQMELEEKQGHSGIGVQLRDISWTFMALFRLQTPGNDLVQNANLMLSVLFFLLTHLPTTIFFSGKDAFEFLLKLFNSNNEQALEACSNFEAFMSILKEKEIIRCGNDFEGVFAASHYHYNLNRVSEFYMGQLTELTVSEIEFLKKPQPKTPIKHIRHRKNNVELKSKRIISWDNELSEAGLRSKLGEVPVSSSPCPNSFTPMSSAMELNNWIREILKKTSITQVPILLQEYDTLSNFSVYAKIEAYRNKLLSVMVDKENLPTIVGDVQNSNKGKTENILKLYVYSLHGMLKNEQKRQGNLSTLYTNENFHQATFACCIECIVFTYGLNINFEQVLSIADVSVFELWKLITTFVQFDSKMPVSLKKHFRDVENYILNENAWNEQSPIRQMIGQFVSECKTSAGNPIFNIFFKRLLSYLAQKLVEITEQLEILEEVKERVWELIKTCITDHMDLIVNRTLDTIVLCSIYAVCKLFKPISFKVLIENFSVLNPTSEHVFKQIAGAGDIIKFYNLFFIPRFKDYLSQGTENLKNFFQSPLRASLPITSPSRNSAFCSPKTPYLTPRTRKLWASAEGTHTIVHKKGRLISFDDEPQLPKIEEDSPVHHKK